MTSKRIANETLAIVRRADLVLARGLFLGPEIACEYAEGGSHQSFSGYSFGTSERPHADGVKALADLITAFGVERLSHITGKTVFVIRDGPHCGGMIRGFRCPKAFGGTGEAWDVRNYFNTTEEADND